MNSAQKIGKRAFDIVVSLTGILLLWWLMFAAFILATVDTRAFGIFRQARVGINGKTFKVVKIRTMRVDTGFTSTVTTARDPRITPLGRLLRKLKIDELPQLFNVLAGSMSIVGPRPDVQGFADRLTGADRDLLSIRPGITGPATLLFRNEEELLRNCDDPELYNANVIYPEKTRINLEYLRNYSFKRDLEIIWSTIFPDPSSLHRG